MIITIITLPCAASEPVLREHVPIPVPDENIHTESLIAQSKGMERKFRDQNLFFLDGHLEEYLKEILEKVAAPEEYERYNLRVRILKNNAPLAFAAPDGAVYVCTGLLARLINESQAAAVLAHELGHIVNDHTEKNLAILKKQSRVLAQQAQAKEPKWKRGPLLPGDGISGSITGPALRAAVYGYMRELENEADSFAIARMAAARYLPLNDSNDFRQFVNSIVNAGKDNRPQNCADKQGSCPGNAIVEEYFSAKLRNAILYDAVANIAAADFELAETQLERLLMTDSTDIDAILMRGDMERLMAPRSAECLNWYEKALRYEPDNIVALRAAGFAGHSIGRSAKAREYLQKYSELAGSRAPDIRMVEEVIRRCEQK